MNNKALAFLKDPLNESSKKVRRNLITASFVGVLVTYLGLIPSKIANLGIEFTQSDSISMLIIIFVSITYFLITFIIYAISDFTEWTILIKSSMSLETENKIIEKSEKQFSLIKNIATPVNENTIPLLKERMEKDVKQKVEEYIRKDEALWAKRTMPIAILRFIIDFLFPIAFSLIPLIKLLKTIR